MKIKRSIKANWGYADDDSVFIKEDIVDFSYAVEDKLNSMNLGVTFRVTDAYTDPPTTIHIEIDDSDGNSYYVTKKIDMRRIRSYGRDLHKYVDDVVDEILSDRESIYSATEPVKDVSIEASYIQPFAMICPCCHNKTLYDAENEAFRPSDVDYMDLCICEECAAEVFAVPQYDGTFKFESTDPDAEYDYGQLCSSEKIDKKDVIETSYDPETLNDLVNYYSSFYMDNPHDVDWIWDDIVGRYVDEDLANDVLAQLEDDYASGDMWDDSDSIYSSEEVEDEIDQESEFDLDEIDQEFTSKDTAQGNKRPGSVPKLFKLVASKFGWPKGAVILDYGCGNQENMDNASAFLDQFGVQYVGYDKYNQSTEDKRAAIKLIRANGGADIVTCSNLLNTIKEPEVRRNILDNMKALAKSGAKIYITTWYDKNKSEGPTGGNKYQLHRRPNEYLEEIREVFPDADTKGELIFATNGGSAVESATNSCNIGVGIASAWDEPERPIDPPDYDDPVYADDEQETIEVDLTGVKVVVDQDGEYDFEDNEWVNKVDSSSSIYSGVYLDDAEDIEERVHELLATILPAAPGTYELKGYASLVYDIKNVQIEQYDEDDIEYITEDAEISFNYRQSSASNVTATKV